MTKGGTFPPEYCDVVVARQLGISIEDIDDVPKVVYNIYLHTYLAERAVDSMQAVRI